VTYAVGRTDVHAVLQRSGGGGAAGEALALEAVDAVADLAGAATVQPAVDARGRGFHVGPSGGGLLQHERAAVADRSFAGGLDRDSGGGGVEVEGCCHDESSCSWRAFPA
jgi:hypothetical protein